ncbi:NAD(P)-dependent oxidoreductase [Bifidobacterium tibiigranuli]|jgi:D-3-phosphoglycerate dehydrogenase|uniref:NAD(P)-dependent oxidoreductase n=1 Tax=Bifidobacterium tibiigranuli TaxID=2172043 RepID=UPI002357925B|nr:NAD(P)-dependent oxidoreductase [Bifidobacterium tibiigranuli]MCI1211417.1 NAD(P)-binding domain-containing protein [Bifidobacterium tibiigranuli]MCI1221257.1 NAD(P)-binding domain-containing protein [Bifidobacterium tibiigranuli]
MAIDLNDADTAASDTATSNTGISILEPLGVPDAALQAERDTLPKDVTVRSYDARPRDDDELIERAKGAEVLVVTNLPLRRAVLEQCTKLRTIAVAFVGVDHIDLDYCREHGITVSNCPGYSNEAVAELVMLLTLALLRDVKANDIAARSARSSEGMRRNEIAGKTFGIIGTGNIGRRVAELAQAFGARTVAWNRTPRKIEGVEFLPLDDVMRQADIITVHVSSTPQTAHLVSGHLIGLMKPNAVLINTARGQIVDNAALAEALNDGRIAGAGIDVFDEEPPLPADDPLLHSPHTMLTPHIGYATDEALGKRLHEAFGNIRAYLHDGTPTNLVA